MITTEQIRVKLNEAIRQSGITQTEIAQKLGVKQATIACYLSAKKTALPALDTFANLCIVLDVDPADILCISEYGGKNVTVSGSFNNNSGSINFKA